MKGDITGLCLCSSPHAMIGALILKVLLSGEERGRGREGEGRGREGSGGEGSGGERGFTLLVYQNKSPYFA